MRKVIGICILIVVLIFVWHLYLTSKARQIAQEISAESTEVGSELSLSLNPITNVVNMRLTMLPPDFDEDNPWAVAGYQLGTAIGSGLIKAMEPLAEREINTKARENLDIYAMLIPYRVNVVLEQPDEQSIALFRSRQEERRQAEERRKRKFVRAYIDKGLRIEDVNVFQGKKFGRAVTIVLGTIVNGGDKTLSQVKVRIYFLDSTGQRIGEKDTSPVLVTKFGFGDQTPLRPNYRKDFGYYVEDCAPSGWAKKVEVEIIEIEFLEEES